MEPKERILRGAEELFFRYGIKSITMDDIARHLCISKKTIYQSFQDKDEVCKLSSSAPNIIEEIFQIMDHLTTTFGQINSNVFYDLQKYHPKSWDLFKKFKENCIQKAMEDALIKGITDGIVRPDISTKILAKLRMEEVEMGFNPELFPPDKFNILDVQLALIDHFLHGICTLEGHKLVIQHKLLKENPTAIDSPATKKAPSSKTKH